MIDKLLGGKLIEQIADAVKQVLPDPKAKQDFEIKMRELQEQAEAREQQLIQGQIDLNKMDSASQDKFASRWRPFIGWTCGVIFAVNFAGLPLLTWLSGAFGYVPTVTPLDWDSVMPVLLAMLGLGGMRSFEKVKGVTR